MDPRERVTEAGSTMIELRTTCEHCNKALPPDSPEAHFLGKDPASSRIRHRRVDPAAHAKFTAPIRNIPPEKSSSYIREPWE